MSKGREGLARRLRRWCRRRLLGRFHYLRGLLFLRRGRLEDAEEALARAVLCAPRYYPARVHLGRVYFLLEEFSRAEQQFAYARFLDPERFAEEELPGRGAAAGETEGGAHGEEETWLGDYEAEGAIYACEEPQAEEGFRYGDFSSYEEWRRFQALPPIRPEEIRNVDWDRIFSDPRSSGS